MSIVRHLAKNLLLILLFTHFSYSQNSSDLEQKMSKKAIDIISQLSVQEKIDQLMNAAPGVERLGITVRLLE